MTMASYHIRLLERTDIPAIAAAIAELGWNKHASLYEQYLEEQGKQQRCVFVAFQEDTFLGYVTLKWQSDYKSFQQQGTPEISDFNVLPQFRNRGIGSKLLERAETETLTKSSLIGIGVGLTGDYGDAQKLYVKRGYVPNGLGITSHCKSVSWGNMIHVDDDLVLWFMKEMI